MASTMASMRLAEFRQLEPRLRLFRHGSRLAMEVRSRSVGGAGDSAMSTTINAEIA
jgi:hypothetical protein